MSGRYHDQFEPAWPGRSVVRQSDVDFANTLYKSTHMLGLMPPNYQVSLLRLAAVKVVDAAIAHAIRESHRN